MGADAHKVGGKRLSLVYRGWLAYLLLCYRQLAVCAYVVYRFVFFDAIVLGAFVLMYCHRQRHTEAGQQL